MATSTRRQTPSSAETAPAAAESATSNEPDNGERAARPQSESPASNVVQAISKIKAELPGIGKVDHSPQLEYPYRGIETLTAHLQGLTAKHGVVIMPVEIRTKEVVEFTVKSGATWTETRVTFRWAVYGPGGTADVIYGESVGHGRDRDDRGASKAMTQAYKEFLIKLFCIGDKSTDPDHTATDEGERFDRGPGRADDTNGRVIGAGEPPAGQRHLIDWHGLGWWESPIPDTAEGTPMARAAKAAHDKRMALVRTEGEKLGQEAWTTLVAKRKTEIGDQLPYSVSQVEKWEALVGEALRAAEAEADHATQQLEAAFGATTEEEAF